MKNYILQIFTIIPYWLIGIALGAYLKTFHSDKVNNMLLKIASWKNITLPVIAAACAGAVSPITLFGLIPILYIFNIRQNRKLEAILTAFITSSILISPNIFIFTISLGLEVAVLRLLFSITAGVILGLLVNILSNSAEPFFNLDIINAANKIYGKAVPAMAGKSHNRNQSKFNQFISGFYKAFKITGINMAIGISISIILFIFVPDSLWEFSFTNNNLAVPISAVLSIGLYQCGGGSIPILQVLMQEGLSTGAALTFMMVGPLTKMTNLAALKSILSLKKLIIYCSILIVYMMIIGWSIRI